jgi:hypothetical protein
MKTGYVTNSSKGSKLPLTRLYDHMYTNMRMPRKTGIDMLDCTLSFICMKSKQNYPLEKSEMADLKSTKEPT